MKLSKRFKKIAKEAINRQRFKKIFKQALKSKIVAIQLLIFMASLNVFLWGIDRTAYRVSDENRYIPAAISYIEQGVRWNWSLPPLGEILIASGINIFGDNPLGWRIMSVIFGALALNAMFALGLVLFQNKMAALEVVLLSLLNHILFVQSRVATLDIFMFTFMAWAFVFFFSYLRDRSRTNFVLTGIFFGLAIACKWFAVIPAIFCFAYYLLNTPKKNWKAKLKEVSMYLFGVPAGIYLLIFSLCFGMGHPDWAPGIGSTKYGFFDFLSLHFKMFSNQLNFSNPQHPFASEWYTWPFSIKQFWYERSFIEIDGSHYLYSIVLLGNPFVLWLGAGSMGFTIFQWLKKEDQLAKVIALTFLTLFLSWAVIPRKTTFFYYYFPASMILSLSLVFVFEKLKFPPWAKLAFIFLCALSFFFFYPALAHLGISTDSALFKLLMY